MIILKQFKMKNKKVLFLFHNDCDIIIINKIPKKESGKYVIYRI